MPLDYRDYHPKWRLISHLIRHRRAGGHCEWCAARNGHPHPTTGSRVVLTVAHLDRDRTHNRFSNLAALCQRCHLNHDRAAHIANRRYGRNWKYTVLPLPFARPARAATPPATTERPPFPPFPPSPSPLPRMATLPRTDISYRMTPLEGLVLGLLPLYFTPDPAVPPAAWYELPGSAFRVKVLETHTLAFEKGLDFPPARVTDYEALHACIGGVPDRRRRRH